MADKSPRHRPLLSGIIHFTNRSPIGTIGHAKRVANPLRAALDRRTRTRRRRRFSDLYGGGVHRRRRRGCPCRTVIDAISFVNEGNISAALLDIRIALESVVPVATQLTDRGILLSSTRVTLTQLKSKKNFRIAKPFTSRLHLKSWSTQLPRY